MIFKNYEYFIAIAEEKSISRASERLYISQPSLSKYLKRLEERLGEQLFHRDSYPISLTTAGELYLKYVSEIVQKEKNFSQELSSLNEKAAGLVSIGITLWRSSVLLPLVLPAFREQYPKIEIQVHEGSHKHMASLLDHDKVDFCIFHLPNNYPNTIFEHLQFEHILLCVNRHHQQLEKINFRPGVVSTLTQEDFMRFSEDDFILLKPGQNIREITQNFLYKQRFTPKVLLETSNIITAMNLVRGGSGITFAPEAAVHDMNVSDDLAFFFIDEPPLKWEVGFAYKTNTLLSYQARLFLESIRNTLDSLNAVRRSS